MIGAVALSSPLVATNAAVGNATVAMPHYVLSGELVTPNAQRDIPR
jgi:hypothetical protein